MNAFNIWLCQDDDKLEVINHRVVFLPHWNGQPFKGGPFVPYHGTSNIKKIANICFKKGIFATVHVPNATYLHQFAWKTGYSHASHVYESSTSSTHRPVQKGLSQKVLKFCLLLLEIVFTLQSEVGHDSCLQIWNHGIDWNTWKLTYPKNRRLVQRTFPSKMVPFLWTFRRSKSPHVALGVPSAAVATIPPMSVVQYHSSTTNKEWMLELV